MDKETIQFVRRRAENRCEYCRIPEAVSDLKHVIDHIVARQHGGTIALENLALCCMRCNQHKGPNLAGMDPNDGGMVRLFNPRTDAWQEHFECDGAFIIARTAIARVTVIVLAINHPLRVTARQSLLAEGIRLE